MTSDDNEESSGQQSIPPAALATAGGAALGAGLGGAAGAAIGAFAGPYLELMLRRSFAEFGADAQQRVRQMMASARETAECTEAELEERLLETEQTRLLNVNAILAAAGTAWPPKVVALGRVLAAGLIAEDDADIDLQQSAMAAMTELERPHITLLDLLVRYEPKAEWGVGWKTVLHRIPSYQSRYLAGGGELFWSVGRRSWTLGQIEGTRPQLTPALTGLLATLRSHGLAQQLDSAPETAKRLADKLAEQINRQAGQNQRAKTSKPPTLRAPKVRDVQERWAPTERGEQVLSYYELAADQGEPAPSE